MRLTRKNTINWLIFILIEILILLYYRAHIIQCEPCLPDTPCPPCITWEQIVSFWTGILIAVGFTLFQIIRFIKKRKSTKAQQYV